jgi:uncharacterized protein YkwD
MSEMQTRIVKLVAAWMLTLLFSTQVLSQPARGGTKRAIVDANAAASMISSLRRSQGLGPVTVDPQLMRLAKQHSQTMAAYNQMGHDVGASFAERRRAIRARIVTENIGAAYANVSEAIAGWNASISHRENMLDPAVSRIGIAAVDAPNSDYYKVFWTLILASPPRP